MQLIDKAIAAFEKNGIPARTVPIGAARTAHISHGWTALPQPAHRRLQLHGVREWIPARSLIR
ncbi:MAG: hypothetical protein ACLU5K_01040 [Christensenellales bacterium]